MARRTQPEWTRMRWYFTVFVLLILFIVITMIRLQKITLSQHSAYNQIFHDVGKMLKAGFQPKSYEVCRTLPVTNIAFLKVHKAGSTTVMNILQRFAYKHNLSLVLPHYKHLLRDNFTNVIMTSRDNKYNMLINHVHHYDRENFQRVLYSDAIYIGIVREPLDLTVSAFLYYRSVWHDQIYQRIRGENPLREYLQNREKYESGFDAHISYTNNRMAHDFGLSQNDFRNISRIRTFIQKIDYDFDFVMIMEYFVESLVLLRRLLCWDIKDVIFIKRNANSKKQDVEFTKTEREYHRNFSMADNMLYDYFLERFIELLNDQDAQFYEEVEVLKEVLDKISTHCSYMNSSTLLVEESQFSPSFIVQSEDCYLMALSEAQFVRLSRKIQLNS